MAPKTVTRQDLLHHIPEDKYLFRECVNYENEIQSLIKINHYDELLPKNDPQFLAPIRRWEKKMGFETPIQWINAILISIYHIIGVVWCTVHFFSPYRCKWQSVLFTILVGQLGGFGITGGAHRYWTHRAFKAKLPLQIIMMIAFSVAGQNNIYNWVRDHRVHHKMSETSADPHDVRRGFFFSHVGWLMMKKHPDVILAGKKIDMSDIMNDPVAKFHMKYFNILKLMCCFILPTITTVYIFGESWSVAILIQCFIRYLLNLHFTWAVNSFAHIWGHKPYNKLIKPTENWYVSMVAMGEGWHNFHHTFPWDYKAAEFSYFLNTTTLIIDAFALFGWAYDMKVASSNVIDAVSRKQGERYQ
ncbi:acyl-CoA Delta(11) desaturase-like [Colias croceus]|uniref:acyl-CoA Delta(11) desaturase-like n=1 Tax=Colias crocea TaxID=72248 RepID=UPI001E27B639|nr:acyl-CoA Delta(11) desaturase-like [Colias croceus]